MYLNLKKKKVQNGPIRDRAQLSYTKEKKKKPPLKTFRFKREIRK